MKNISNFKYAGIVILIIIIILCFVPNTKVDAIGDFFEKVLTPLVYPLSLIIATLISTKYIKKIHEVFNGRKK